MKYRNNPVLAVIAGFGVSMGLIWLPIIGPFAAGIVAGIIAGTARKGAVLALISGIIGLVIFSLAAIGFSQVLGSALGGSSQISHSVGLGLTVVILILDALNLIIITIAGYIGGLVSHRI